MGSTEDQAVAWRALCFELARALKCLPSVSVGGNRHVLAAAEEAQAAREASPVSPVCAADAQATAMAARRVSNWMAAGCSGEPPRPQLALLHTLCAEMAAGALGARAQRVTQGAQ